MLFDRFVLETGADDSVTRDLSTLVVARVGKVVEYPDSTQPWRLFDQFGQPVEPVDLFLRDMLSCDRSVASLRSYGFSLLHWFRFLWAVDVPWDRAQRAHARDFALWLACVAKPPRRRRADAPAPGSVNALTGKPYAGLGYAARTRRHVRAAARSFYEFHRVVFGRPLVNPFPAKVSGECDVSRHHNPMEPFARSARPAPYQPRLPKRFHRAIGDALFADLFAALGCDRDRALVAFYVSTAARASELLGLTQDRVNAPDQLVGVYRKGSRALQWLPAAPDAFVWLRLYQRSLWRLIQFRPGDSVWWTLRQPLRPLTYDAMRMVFTRANAVLGSNWTLHDLRHTALQRMARDPSMSLVDVKWIAGHAHLSSTEPYLEPNSDEVVTAVLAHHKRRAEPNQRKPMASPGYRAEVLETLLGPTAGRLSR
jgi:integrase